MNDKMSWEELKHEINMKIMEFKRECGNGPDVLIVGKKEYAILEDNKSNSEDFEAHGNNISIWSMKVRLDESKESHIELIKKKTNFLKITEYTFTPYRIRVEAVMPAKLGTPFVSFLDGQNASDIGVQIVGGGKALNRGNKDLVYYQVSVEGPNKDLVRAWVNYLYEIEKAYTIELTCDICGEKWVECRDTYYDNHLDGSKDLCGRCKIHE